MANSHLEQELLRRLVKPMPSHVKGDVPKGELKPMTGTLADYPTDVARKILLGTIQPRRDVATTPLGKLAEMARSLVTVNPDDPLLGADPSGPAQAVTQFIASKVPSKALRSEATTETLSRLKEMFPTEAHPQIETFVKNPRIAAHMDVSEIPYRDVNKGLTVWGREGREATRSNPIMAQTDPGYTRVPVKLRAQNGRPLNDSQVGPEVVAHEAAHVAQALGMPEDALWTYLASQDALLNVATGRMPNNRAETFAYQQVPHEIKAREAEVRALLDPQSRRLTDQSPGLLERLNDIAQKVKVGEGDSSLLDRLLAMQQRRAKP
jgi:hypothetical protein